MKRYFASMLLLLLTVACTYAQRKDTLCYHLSLTDKQATEYSLSEPAKFLSEKALYRRTHQGLEVDSTDLPIPKAYINAIQRLGVKVVARGKWDNFVTVSLNDTTVLASLRQLPFVSKAYKVWQAPAEAEHKTTRDSLINYMTQSTHPYYGPAYDQIHISYGDSLHAAGFTGRGMTIAVIDGGFHNLDRMAVLDNVKLKGYKNMVNDGANVFDELSHGTSVLSCMAANKPGYMVGTAPEAEYWALRSEDGYSEQLIEGDYWSAAAEYADSLGVDLINTSLGYFEFDDTADNLRHRDLDGRSTVITRTASMLAKKGIVLVCSAGNDGGSSWKKITPPADAFDILTVGAIDRDGVLARFSSVGVTADGRIKPDVMAVGVQSDIINAHGSMGHGSGTSFAAPIMCGMVACLWQACPKLTALQLIELVRSSGDRADYPDNIYGYGVPNLWKAYQRYLRAR